MAGKSPYATLAERRAVKLEGSRQRYLRAKSDPVLHEQLLEAQREKRALESAERERAKAMPKPVNVQLYRQHGPFAPLFALQAAA